MSRPPDVFVRETRRLHRREQISAAAPWLEITRRGHSASGPIPVGSASSIVLQTPCRRIKSRECVEHFPSNVVENLLTEQEISRTWQKLFRDGSLCEETFTRAEALLEELRAESPLRHRLEGELEELRKMSGSAAAG